jgi:hypothetical protein
MRRSPSGFCFSLLSSVSSCNLYLLVSSRSVIRYHIHDSDTHTDSRFIFQASRTSKSSINAQGSPRRAERQRRESGESSLERQRDGDEDSREPQSGVTERREFDTFTYLYIYIYIYQSYALISQHSSQQPTLTVAGTHIHSHRSQHDHEPAAPCATRQ